jgi:hypothetical protein
MSSLCYVAPLPIIIHSSNTKFYEFLVVRTSEKILSSVLEFNVKDSKAILSRLYRINECGKPVDPGAVEHVKMMTGFNHADVLHLEIPGVYKKIGVEFNDSKIEIRKIEEE